MNKGISERCAIWFPGKQASEVYGYGRVRTQLITALRHAGFSVVDGGFDCPENVIQISHYQPFNPERYKKTWKPRPEARFRILYTTFESSSLPDGWAHNAAMFDAVWTTSEFCVELFRRELDFIGRSDVPVFRVRHGIDSATFPPMDRRHQMERPFLFFAKGIHPADRKQSQQVMDAFERINIKNTHLLVKAAPSAHKRGQFRNFKGITLVSDWWTDDEQRVALLNASCFVQPTRCEGFGLEPLEAMATGLPTITTPYSGIRDYYFGAEEMWKHIKMENDWGKHSKGNYFRDPTIDVGPFNSFGVCLPFKEGPAFYNEALESYKKQLVLGEIPDENRRPELETDEWDFGVDAVVSMDDLCAAMEFAYRNSINLHEITRRSAYYIHRDWTWHHAIADVVASFYSLGLMDTVHWSKGEATKWLDFIRRLNSEDEFKNFPKYYGTEDPTSDELIGNDDFLKV